MSRLIIHNQAVYNGLTKELIVNERRTDNENRNNFRNSNYIWWRADEKVEYINNVLHYKAVVLHEEYSDSEIKTISKFFNDWFKDTYIYGSDAIEVVGSVKEEKKEEFHCGFEESGGHAYNCNDCSNKCEEYYQWDKEIKNGQRKTEA